LLLTLLSGPAQAQFQVDVNLAKEHQIMAGTGGNAYGWITDPSKWSPVVLDKIINDLTVTHVRIRSYSKDWEPANDNNDPYSINWSAFKDQGHVHDDFVLLEKLSKAGIQCIFGVFDAPDWMVLNPQASKNRIVPPEMYTEFAEQIVSYILYAKQHYGANITVISLQNEPNIGIYLYFSPEELADVAEVVLDCMDSYGLSDIMLHVGDVNNPADGIKFYQPSLDRPSIFRRTAAVSFHTWVNMTIPHLNAIRDFLQNQSIGSWATEVGTSSLNSETYEWALGSMKHHHYAIKHARSSLTFQWCLAGAESSLDKNGNPYPVYHALKHFHRHITPGSVCVDTGGEPSSLLTTAFMDKESKTLSIVTTDTDYYGQNVTYTLKAPGIGYWPPEVYKTTASMHYQNLGKVPITSGKVFDYFVEPESFHTFTCSYNSIPKLSIHTEPSTGYPGYVDHVLTLTDKDGIQKDFKKQGVAGVALYQNGLEVLTILITDPDPPGFFKLSLDPSGTVLTMRLVGFPQNLGMMLYGGGVDKDGGMAIIRKSL
jgi:O-glycosyl hydrolase